MIERGGVKIGIVGITNDDSYAVSSPGDLKITNGVIHSTDTVMMKK